MNFKTFSNEQLVENLKKLIQQERSLLSELLLNIKEIDRRKFFLDFGYPNLFEYLTKEMGYSAGAAHRRIDAARLLSEIPALSEKIEAGKIHLNQISILQKAVRQSRSAGHPISTSQKQSALDLIADKNQQQTEQLVAEHFDLEIKAATKQTCQADESVRIELTLSKEQFTKLQKAKELLSHSVPTGDLASLLEYLSDKVIQQKTRSRTSTVEVKTGIPDYELPRTAENKRRKMSAVSPRTIPATIRKNLFRDQNCCQYRDNKTDKQCSSRWQLQVDHIQPVWAGGSNHPSNLRLLCGAHNRHAYRQQSHIRASS